MRENYNAITPLETMHTVVMGADDEFGWGVYRVTATSAASAILRAQRFEQLRRHLLRLEKRDGYVSSASDLPERPRSDNAQRCRVYEERTGDLQGVQASGLHETTRRPTRDQGQICGAEMIHTKELPSIPPWAPQKGQKWQHADGGVYNIVGVGLEEATLALVVIYEPIHDVRLWTRPLPNFMQRFKQL